VRFVELGRVLRQLAVELLLETFPLTFNCRRCGSARIRFLSGALERLDLVQQGLPDPPAR
jgi:hypothetical protein